MNEDEEMSYKEILANLALNGELIVTVPIGSEDEVKTGLKNVKNRQAIKMEKEGLPKIEEVLQFSSFPSKEYEDCVDLHISLKRKGTVIVKKMIIPDNTFS